MSVSAMQHLQQRHTHRAFIFRVAGVPVEYYGGAGGAPAQTLMPNTAAGQYYRQRSAIHAIGTLSTRMFPEGGIAQHDAISITLAGDARDPDDDDPLTVFDRLGYRAATNRAQLVAAVAQASGGGTLTVDRDCSGWGYPRPVHVDREAFWATAATAVAPYTITYTARGSIGTVPQRHGARDTNIPDVSDTVVHWRSRRATLYMAEVHPGSGTRSDYIEVMRGFIDTKIKPDTVNGLVTIRFVPLAALLQDAIANPEELTTLCQGAHHFVHPHANGLVHAQAFEEGAAVNTVTTAADGAGTGNITAPTTQHQAVADTGLNDGEPRRVDLRTFRSTVPNVVTGYAAGPAQHTLAAGPNPAINAGDAIVNVAVEERHVCPVQSGPPGTETTVAWPAFMIDKLNDSADPDSWVPGTVAGVSGAWADVRVTEDTLLIRTNMADHAGDLKVILPVGQRVPRSVRARDTDDLVADNTETVYAAHGGVDWRDPATDDVQDWATPSSTRPRGQATAYPARVIVVEKDHTDTGEGVAVAPFRGWALGFYQNGEPYLFAANDLYVTPHRPVTVRIDWTDRVGQDHTAYVDVTASNSKTVGSITGYAWTLNTADARALPTFSAWRGRQPPRIRPVLRFNREKPGPLILKLLLSGGGNLVNHSGYDVLANGANLTEDDVDVQSFRAIAPPPGLEEWSFTIEDDTSIADVVNPLLIACGYSMVVRRDAQGRARLTAVQVGLENAVEVVGEIEAGDWIVDPPPKPLQDDEITNLIEIETDFIDGEPLLRVVFHDEHSVRAFGEANKLTLPLRGARVPNLDQVGAAEALFGPLKARLFRQLAHPRRKFSGGVYTGAALRAELGAIYRLSSPHLKAYGTPGVVRVMARVVSTKIDVWGEGAELEFVHYGSNGAGWGFSATVVSIPAADQVVVSVNDFTAAGGDLDDIDGARVTAVLRWVPEADNDAYTGGHVVTAIDSATPKITFSGAHGIAHTATVPNVAAWLEPDDYDAVLEAFMQGFAYLADSTPTLGAAGDEGREIT